MDRGQIDGRGPLVDEAVVGSGVVAVGVSLAAFLVYALLMEPLGFVLSSVLLIGALSLFYGARDLRIVLAISLGVPVAIWLVVRYQFIAQSVMLDGTDGRGAMRRSRRLVDGRWLHTAIMVLLINGVVVATAFLLGLLVLVLLTGIPLWAFNVFTALVYAVLVPLAAAAYTLLYGDRVAASESAPESVVEEVAP